MVIGCMTHFSVTLTHLGFLKSKFSMKSGGRLGPKEDILFYLEQAGVQGASRETQGWQQHPSPLLCLSSVYPVQLTSLLQKQYTDVKSNLRLKKHPMDRMNLVYLFTLVN